VGELIQTSHVKIHKEKGTVRKAYIENFPQPVEYGLHGAIKKFYGVERGEDAPSTMDHVVAALGSCMTGTLAGALAARKIPTQPDKLSADVEGVIENVNGTPMITRIRVKYHVKVPQGKREEAERAIQVHEKGCPVSQSVQRGIQVEWEGAVEEEQA
jgi:uncharacterized OsmC-like protein